MIDKEVKVEQTTFQVYLLQLPKMVRFVGAVFTAALVAYYIPFLAASFFGSMLNQFWMWTELLISVSLLAALSLIGNKLNCVWPVALVAAVLMSIYEFGIVVRTATHTQLFVYMIKAYMPVVSIIFNALLFVWLRRYIGLGQSS